MKISYWKKVVHDATHKAFEATLGNNKDALNKWDEEIKKEVCSKVGVSGRRRGWGNGGGGNELGSSKS